MDLPLENINSIAEEYYSAMVDFAQHIICTPSLSGQENEIAGLISNEMVELGYDEVWVDQAGNVIGKILGGDGPVVMLNGHMDHVDPGPIDYWPYPPFSGQIVEGELWGRAAVDMKGPVACMIYAASLFKQIGLTPPGDVYMTVPVMEEIGGLGTQHLVSHLNAHAAICGEPSNNTLRRGHRGRVELMVTFEGKSAHASVPELAVNPHLAAASFLSALSDIKLGHDDTLGSSTMAPTLYSTDQFSPNVIPSHVYLTLDCRNVPGESPDDVVAKTEELLNICLDRLENGPQYKATVMVPGNEFITYTGLSELLPSIFPSYILPENDQFVQAAHTALTEALERDVDIDIWRFATDGGHLMAAGIPTVGFGPGDEVLAHTNQERVNLAQMREAMVGYVALVLALGQVV